MLPRGCGGLLAPSERRAWMVLELCDGRRLPVRVIKMSNEHVVVEKVQ